MSRPTTIREFRCFSARSTLSQPIADATHVIPAIEFVVGEVELVNGVVGQSYLLAFHYSPQAIRGALRDLAAFARGRDAAATQAFIRDWNHETEYFGQEGLQRWALGLANVAMWDAHARTLDVPVWRLLGGEAWDAVLCDLMMPSVTGDAVYEAVLAARPALAARFAFLTGGATTAEAEGFLARVGRPVLLKPMADVAALRAAVNALLADADGV
jgi:L-alanine-DL-glutamate epimerase-like enolase superfamily enzyme